MECAVTPGQLAAAAAALVITATSLIALLASVASPAEVNPFNPKPGHPHWELVKWERERLQGFANKMAGAAVTFLGSLLTAVLKGEVSRAVPAVWIAGAALGVVGTLLVAFNLHRAAGAWARPYYASAP